MKSIYRNLELAIGYRFKKKSLLELALTHPSYRYEADGVDDDNQRLEYLGDAVLSLISAEHLYQTQPGAREGDMSKLRSRLTQDRQLARIGASIGVGEVIRLGRGEQLSGGGGRASNLADAVEAILGAAWLDGGAKAVNKIFKKVFLPALDELHEAEVPANSNPKGELQEYAQRNRLGIPTYETVGIDGPEHDRRFTVEVKIGGNTWRATAASKREAERQAAMQALADRSR